MGCASSKTQKQLETGGDLYNKEGDTQRKLMTGLHIAKGPDSVEANFQICLWKRTRKKYEKVASGPVSPSLTEPQRNATQAVTRIEEPTE